MGFGVGQYQAAVTPQSGALGGQFVHRQTVPSGLSQVVSCLHGSVADLGQTPTFCNGGHALGFGAMTCHVFAVQAALVRQASPRTSSPYSHLRPSRLHGAAAAGT